jgi:hypothetical protein
MAVPEALRQLREEFIVRAAQSAKDRYLREAHHLTDAQLSVRRVQLVVRHRRLAREMDASATGNSLSRTQQLLLMQDMEAQKDAVDAVQFERTARFQTATVSSPRVLTH